MSDIGGRVLVLSEAPKLVAFNHLLQRAGRLDAMLAMNTESDTDRSSLAVDVVSPSIKTGIESCPNEILCEIFELYQAESLIDARDGVANAFGWWSILLVCVMRL